MRNQFKAYLKHLYINLALYAVFSIACVLTLLFASYTLYFIELLNH